MLYMDNNSYHHRYERAVHLAPTISPKLKAEMCDPSNPTLKVNTTESRICNIPKTVKNVTTAAAASPTTTDSNYK